MIVLNVVVLLVLKVVLTVYCVDVVLNVPLLVLLLVDFDVAKVVVLVVTREVA